MRPGQQNRRMRGRGGGGGNNRKGPNPLTRNYESNGPDVKIRGSAQQIAEKYANLARDAQSAGDRVMAENYLQHAEHYNRIIAAAQAQFASQQQARDSRDDFEDETEDEREDVEQAQAPAAAEAPRQQPITGAEPQPVIEGMPAEVALEQEAAGREGREEQRRPNGNGEEHEEAPASRRSRRPRRSRSRADQESAAEAGEPSDAGPERSDANEEIVVPAAAES